MKKQTRPALTFNTRACVAFTATVMSFLIQSCSGHADSALPFPEANQEQVTIPSGSLSIAGELILPDGEGPFPAVVQIGGAPPTPKEHIAARAHAFALATHGIATLTYDSRGTGGSDGVYFAGDYRAFVEDVHAALEFLNARADIAGDQLCYVGHSEGGFLMPEVALTREEIKCAYLRVAPVRDFRSLRAYQIATRLRKRGLPESDIAEAVQLLEALHDFYEQALEEPAFYASAAKTALNIRSSSLVAKHGQKMIDVMANPIVPARFNRGVLERQVHQDKYSARSFLEQDPDIPMLYVFGELDENLDTMASVAYLNSLASRTDQVIETHVYPGEDHSLYREEYLPIGGYPPGYYDRMTSWISAHIKKGEE